MSGVNIESFVCALDLAKLVDDGPCAKALELVVK